MDKVARPIRRAWRTAAVNRFVQFVALIGVPLSAAAELPKSVPEQFSCARAQATAQLITRLDTLGRPAVLLLMSGGGAYGAWGAGVLSATHSSLGQIDVVTGVSTGALASTLVFLALSSADPSVAAKHWHSLGRLNTETTNDQIYRRRWLLTALFSDAFNSTTPLKKTLKRELDDNLLNEVAAVSKRADAPQLCVGTVNLASGQFEEWDLGAIAQAGEFTLYREVVRASAAIPVLFPPVALNGRLHVDGGTRKNIFSQTVVRTAAASARAMAASQPGGVLRGLSPEQRTLAIRSEAAIITGLSEQFTVDASADEEIREILRTASPKQRPTAHVLINGYWDVKEDLSVKPRLLSVGSRSLGLLTAARMTGNVYELLYRLNSLDGRGGAEVYKLRFSWIPDGYVAPADCGVLDFGSRCMRPLFEAGRAAADTAWKDFPPPL
jgi:predicted acylesterase/phospholipase RssA